MRRRIRVALAACQAVTPVVERVAARFATLVDVRVYPTAADGTAGDAGIQAIAEAMPDVVIAMPKPAARLAARVEAPVVRFEFPARVVLARIEEALRQAQPIALLAPAGTIDPALAERIGLWRGSVFLFPFEDRRHLHGLVARCRRMGVKGLVGGGSTTALASEEGLIGVSLDDRPEEPNGGIADVIAKAASRATLRLADGRGEMRAVRVALGAMARGGLRPGDTAIGVDRDGRVTALVASPAGPDAGEPPVIPPGAMLFEAVAVLTGQAGVSGRDLDALAMDLYPVGRAAARGYLAVLHGTPRSPEALSDRSPALHGAMADGDRFAQLIRKIGRLVDPSAS